MNLVSQTINSKLQFPIKVGKCLLHSSKIKSLYFLKIEEIESFTSLVISFGFINSLIILFNICLFNWPKLVILFLG